MSDFEAIYNDSIMISQNLTEDIRFSRNFNFDHIEACSNHICEYLNTNTNILALLHRVQDKNPYMYSHPVNVAFIAGVIGKWMNLNKSELSKLICTGILHDIGKAKIRDSILNKAGKLSDSEMETARTHATLGYRLLTSFNVDDPDILLGVLSHHERQDGSGYPRKLKGEQINNFGRIIAIADIYDAMTSTKAYHEKITPFKVIDEIQELSFGLLDPQISQVFLNNMSNFYYGSVVRLSDERIGEIVYVNQEERTKPLIHCNNEYINLTLERDLEIVEMLSY